MAIKRKQLFCSKKSCRKQVHLDAYSPIWWTGLTYRTYRNAVYYFSLGLRVDQAFHALGGSKTISYQQAKRLWARLQEAMAWQCVEDCEQLVFKAGEVECDVASVAVSRDRISGTSKHCGRFLILCDRTSGQRGVFWLPDKPCEAGAPPPPESFEEVLPILRRKIGKRHILMSDGAQATSKAAKFLGVLHTKVVHAKQQFSKFEKIPAESLSPELLTVAQKRREKEMTVMKRPAASIMKRPAASIMKRPASLRLRVSSNQAEAQIGVIKNKLRMNSRLKGHTTHLSRDVFSASYSQQSPGLAGVQRAMKNYMAFFQDSCSPGSAYAAGNWMVHHKV